MATPGGVAPHDHQRRLRCTPFNNYNHDFNNETENGLLKTSTDCTDWIISMCECQSVVRVPADGYPPKLSLCNLNRKLPVLILYS